MNSITIRPAENGAIVIIDQREGYYNDNYQVFNKIEDMFDYLAELLDESFPLAAEQEELAIMIDMESLETARSNEGGEIGTVTLHQQGKELAIVFSMDNLKPFNIPSEIDKYRELINKAFKQGDDRLDVRKQPLVTSR